MSSSSSADAKSNKRRRNSFSQMGARMSRDGRLRGKRRRYITNGQNRVLRIPTLGSLPPRCRVKMAYADTFILGGGAPTQATRVYRLNSVWDPDYTGTGVTATGYSTFAALYGRYFVHHSNAEVRATIREQDAATVSAINVMVGCAVSDFLLTSPSGAWDTELLLEQYKLQNMPRGTGVVGGLFRMNHNIVTRGVSGNGVAISGSAMSTYNKNKQGPSAYYFKDKRSYHLDDPLATLVTGGFIEHEAEGEFPLTGAIGNVPIDNVFLTAWAFALPDSGAAALPLPNIYFTVTTIMDVEWYAPNGVAAPSAAAAGAQAGLDETQT